MKGTRKVMSMSRIIRVNVEGNQKQGDNISAET